jgi:5-formyltetrahydrofolate cyclo-ligase
MEDIKETKGDIRSRIENKINAVSDDVLLEKANAIENRLFEFANFLESNISMLYLNKSSEVISRDIVKRSFGYNRIIILPAYDTEKHELRLLKVEDIDKDLVLGEKDVLEPDQTRCKSVPVESVDIAVIPGIAFDEKGGRIGTGEGYYDRFIPTLSATTRKVALAYEDQVVSQIPMEPHDKHVDIIITEKRIIYKI